VVQKVKTTVTYQALTKIQISTKTINEQCCGVGDDKIKKKARDIIEIKEDDKELPTFIYQLQNHNSKSLDSPIYRKKLVTWLVWKKVDVFSTFKLSNLPEEIGNLFHRLASQN